MKIYFSTTPRAKDIYPKEIDAIFHQLKKTEHVLVDNLIEGVESEEFYNWDADQRKKYYRETINSIRTADVCIFEASCPSLGVGYLIDKAIKAGKPVIVLFLEGKKPFMLESADEEKILLVQYDMSSLTREIEMALDYAAKASDVRFNFFISPAIGEYLDWVSRVKKIPRSVYLRSLIEAEMSENNDYLNQNADKSIL